MTKLNYFYLSFLLFLTVGTIYSQEQGDEIMGVAGELSIQNQTNIGIFVWLESFEMPYETAGGCYFNEILYFSNYIELIPANNLLTDYGFTILGDDDYPYAPIKLMKYSANKIKFKYGGSYIKYSNTEDLFFQYDRRDAHYYGCEPEIGHDVNIRIVKEGDFYRIWFVNDSHKNAIYNAAHPSTLAGWHDASQSTIRVWELGDNQSHCDIRWDINPPEAPQMISLTANFGQHPTISWRANTEPDLSGYRVYKKLTTSSGTITAYSFTTNTTYTDNDFTSDYKFGTDTAEYWVVAVDNSNYLSAESVHKSTDGTSLIQWKIANEKENDNSISTFELFSNYPNPFNPTTQISYQLPEKSFVNLIVYNTLGQQVAQLVNQHQTSGLYSVEFDANNLPSGIYIYKLEANDFSATKKMILAK